MPATTSKRHRQKPPPPKKLKTEELEGRKSNHRYLQVEEEGDKEIQRNRPHPLLSTDVLV